MKTFNYVFSSMTFLLIIMLQHDEVCSEYQIENTRDYKIYISSRPLTALTQFSVPSVQQSSSRVSVPTVMCGAHLLAPDLLLTSIRCYPWSSDSVDVYIFPKDVESSELNWKVKEAKVIHNEALVNVTFFLDFPLSPGNVVSNAALVLLDSPYLAATQFADLDIPMNEEE